MQHSSAVITKDMNLGSFWARSRRSVQIDMCSSFCSAVRRRSTNFAVTSLIRKSSFRIFWHIPNAILTSSATSLIVRCRPAQMISRTRATVFSVWEVEGLPGRVSSSKDRRPLLKWEYHSNVFDRLRHDSPKAACRISYVSAPVFPRQYQTSMHTRCCTFSSIMKCDAHCCRRSPKGLHRANGRDTDLRFCTYTCTELPRVPLCCHFATYYSFPEKKSVLELNDQPTYYIFVNCNGDDTHWQYYSTHLHTNNTQNNTNNN